MSVNKNRSITIRVRKDEHMWLESAASSEELSISSFLRRILVKYVKENYPKQNPNKPAWLLELERERNEG